MQFQRITVIFNCNWAQVWFAVVQFHTRSGLNNAMHTFWISGPHCAFLLLTPLRYPTPDTLPASHRFKAALQPAWPSSVCFVIVGQKVETQPRYQTGPRKGMSQESWQLCVQQQDTATRGKRKKNNWGKETRTSEENKQKQHSGRLSGVKWGLNRNRWLWRG